MTPEALEDAGLTSLYVLFTPSVTTPDGMVDGDQVVEVGRGSSPCTPEDWPEVSLRQLVDAALRQP